MSDVVTVFECVPLFVARCVRIPRCESRITAQPGFLDQSLGDIDPETVNVLVEPEPQNLIELILDPRVAPVQVRLVWQEEMEVVLTGLVVKGPGGPTEVTDPVVWGASIGTRVSPDVVVSEVAGQRGAGLCEPWVLDAGVIGNEVENDPDTSGVGIGHQPIKVVHVAVHRIDRAVVRYVVAEIRHRRREERCDPHQVNTKCLEMIEMGNGPTQVTDAVAIGIGERSDVQAITNRTVPPARVMVTASRQPRGLPCQWRSVGRVTVTARLGPDLREPISDYENRCSTNRRRRRPVCGRQL